MPVFLQLFLFISALLITPMSGFANNTARYAVPVNDMPLHPYSDAGLILSPIAVNSLLIPKPDNIIDEHFF
jgi:hypothetical protein